VAFWDDQGSRSKCENEYRNYGSPVDINGKQGCLEGVVVDDQGRTCA
jgi:hypothetical protein